MKEHEGVHCGTKKEWRTWLEKNHQKENHVALIIHKKHTGKPSISHRESMDEAICFGWIDTTLKKLDEDRYVRNFRRRGPNANWSKNTLSYAKQLIKEGRMAPAGLAAYNLGIKKLPLDHDIPDNPDPPRELLDALKQNKQAEANFNSLAPSYKRTYLRWIIRAKQPETKMKRIRETIKRLGQNKRAFV